MGWELFFDFNKVSCFVCCFERKLTSKLIRELEYCSCRSDSLYLMLESQLNKSAPSPISQGIRGRALILGCSGLGGLKQHKSAAATDLAEREEEKDNNGGGGGGFERGDYMQEMGAMPPSALYVQNFAALFLSLSFPEAFHARAGAELMRHITFYFEAD